MSATDQVPLPAGPPPSATASAIIEVPLDAGDTCLVRWRNGERNLQATVLERRRIGHRKRKWHNNDNTEKKKETEGIGSLKANQMEYYVHYEGHDRRLDEWISLDKFVLSTLERRHQPEQPPQTTGVDHNSSNNGQSNSQELSIAASNSEETAGDASGKEDSATDATASEKKTTATSKAATDTETQTPTPPPPPAPSRSLAPTMGGNWHGASGDPALAAFEKEHEETTRLKNIAKIWMGKWLVEAWYYSPFPDEYSGLDCLYVCEFCLSYCRKIKTYKQHLTTCPQKRPPGKRIYSEPDLAVYELDGNAHPAYCQKLCLMAKLFLDHKTLYYNVTPFYFYVVCRVDPTTGYSHIVGYFSKEKHSLEGYNLACILTFPQYQKAGYGKFIISLSYELTKRQGLTGSPEKPLSDLGKVSYRSYWKHVLFHLLANHDTAVMEGGGGCKDLSIGEMSAMTGIKHEDILSTLQHLDMIKVWKGQHVVYVEQTVLQQYLDQKKKFRLCNPDCLDWQAPPPSSENNKQLGADTDKKKL